MELTPHPRATRLVHMGLALAVVLQLVTSLVMHGPDENSSGDFLFEIHEFSGFAALAFALLFWLIMLAQSRRTGLGAIFPWFSGARMRALWADIKTHLRALMKLGLPDYHHDAPLAAAVHGLGLLLISLMATTGTIYALGVWLGWHGTEPDDVWAIKIHVAFANLVWVYLIGHAALGALHHVMHDVKLWRIFSLR